MKIYNDEYVQKVFEVIDWDYIAVDNYGTLLAFRERPVANSSIDCWSGCGFVLTNNIDLNGMDWKDSLRVRKWVPNECEDYWTIDFVQQNNIAICMWENLSFDKERLEKGLVFKTKEEAIACSKRMLDAVKK